LFRGGQPSKIEVPAKYGDFSITHTIIPKYYCNKVVIEFIPNNLDENIYAIWAKAECPEAVAMYAYNMKSEIAEYWVYNFNTPVLVKSETYDEKLDNPESWKCHEPGTSM